MRSASDFYTTLHDEEKHYSGASYNMASLWPLRPLATWAAEAQGRPVRLLDVGCGKGYFMRDFVRGLDERWRIKPSRIAGIDIVRSSGDVFEQISPRFEFVQHDTDGNPLPFESGSFEFLSCNHVLEHVFETEKLVREFRRVLTPNGLCIIAVPNCAAWVNRIGALWGNQPLGSELGTEKVTYGFRPAFLQRKLAPFRPSGHIRDFTPRGLQDLTEHCGFETVGWWKQSFGFVAQLGKWAGRNVAILLRPAKAGH
jgi:SAM-dependent methyltransferase